MQTESENTSTYLVTSSVGIALSHTAPTVYGRFTLPRISKTFTFVNSNFYFSSILETILKYILK